MKREFVLTEWFDKYWTALGMTDEELRRLQNILLSDPRIGAVIPHTGGARKVRIELEGVGKRSGARVIYVDIVVDEKIYFLLAYPKSKKENLSQDETKKVASLVKSLKG